MKGRKGTIPKKSASSNNHPHPRKKRHKIKARAKPLFCLMLLLVTVISTLITPTVNTAYAAVESMTVQFPGQASQQQSKTATLPANTAIRDVRVDSGTVNYTQSGQNVNLTVDNGTNTSTITDPYMYSQYAQDSRTSSSSSFSSSLAYNSGGYSGTLSKNGSSYVISGYYTPSDSMYVSNQTSSYYNSGGYSGSLTRYTAGYTTTPSDSKYVDGILGASQSGSCNSSMGTGWQNCGPAITPPSSKSYNSGGYSGTLYQTDYQYSQTYNAAGTSFTWSRKWYYGGTVTKPATSTPYYRYEGYVYKPSYDSRTWRQDYAGTVYQAGQQTVYTYTVTIDYVYDTEAPVIGLTQTPTTPTNEDVTINTVVTDAGAGVEKASWKPGQLTLADARSGGTALSHPNDSFAATENGFYTIYAIDNGGNEAIKVIEVTNIDREPPVLMLLGDFKTWTNKPLPVQVKISSDTKEVVSYKMASGKQAVEHFASNGTSSADGHFLVPQNGDYTFYMKDSAGNETIRTVNVTNIDKVNPTFDVGYDTTEPTRNDVVVSANAADALSGIRFSRWEAGTQTIDYFRGKNGRLLQGGQFRAPDNGKYTIYAVDLAGNDIIQVIEINNIDKAIPATPTFTATPTTPNAAAVTVTVNYDPNGTNHQYRIRDGVESTEWRSYTGPLSITRNGVVEARTHNTAGVASGIGRLNVSNIASGTTSPPPVSDNGEYEIPIQQSEMTDLGVTNNKRSFEMAYQTDLFFMSKHGGFQSSYPYAADVKKQFESGIATPSAATLSAAGKASNKLAFETKYSGENVAYVDEVLHVDENFDLEKLQRYYLPVEASSPLEAGVVHTQRLSMDNIGLNDISIEYDQTFTFDQYLFGSGADNAWMIEQVDSKVKISDVDADKVTSLLITNEEITELAVEQEIRATGRVHDFRLPDRTFKDKVKELLNWGSE